VGAAGSPASTATGGIVAGVDDSDGVDGSDGVDDSDGVDVDGCTSGPENAAIRNAAAPAASKVSAISQRLRARTELGSTGHDTGASRLRIGARVAEDTSADFAAFAGGSVAVATGAAGSPASDGEAGGEISPAIAADDAPSLVIAADALRDSLAKVAAGVGDSLLPPFGAASAVSV